MGCTTNRSTVRVSAAQVSWGVQNKFCVSTDSATLTGGEYFDFSSAGVLYRAWFDVDNGDTAPAAAGRTLVEIDLTAPFTASDIGLAMKSSIEAIVESTLPVFYVDLSENNTCVCVKMINVGSVLDVAADGDTGFDIETTRTGIGGDLGRTQGGVSVSFEVTTLDITTDQGGTSIYDKIIQGVNASVSMSLLEMTPAKWELIVGQYAGDTYTPGGGTKVVGFGESRNFSSAFELGGKLVLHPLDRDATDLSEDIAFWLSAPIPGSYNFSGEDVSLMEVEFSALPDRGINNAVNIFSYGDHTQDLRN